MSTIRIPSWGPRNPGTVFKVIIGMAAGDDGSLQYQMECGHICWLYPKPDSLTAEDELHDILAKFEADIHVLESGCLSCTNGQTSHLYPLGVALPVPAPPDNFPHDQLVTASRPRIT